MKCIPRPLILIKAVITEGKCQIFGFSFIFERGVMMDLIRIYKTKRKSVTFPDKGGKKLQNSQLL